MINTYYKIPDEGIKQFLLQYIVPGRKGESMSHDGISVSTDSDWSHFDFLTQEPIAPLVKSTIGQGMVREFPGPDYLGQFTLVTNALTLYKQTFNEGRPEDRRLVAGFQRLAELLCIDLPL